MSEIEIFLTPDALAHGAAERIVTLAAEAISAQGRFSLGLSGGETPSSLYALLADDAFAARIEWEKVHVFWGDERCVPPDHPDSNYRMTRERLLDHVPLPEENIHRMRGETEPIQTAAEYEQILRVFFVEKNLYLQPRFDLLLLGMGSDGHIASLFPGTRALYERTRWVLENYIPQLDTWRLTLTPVAINAAANVIFLVTGENKAEALYAVIRGQNQPEKYPAQLVQPTSGTLLWMVDEAAAALL
jgi:6-phosphogluconolactonase